MSAAALAERIPALSADRVRAFVPGALTWLGAFLLVALVAGNAGGFRPTTWGWTALVTLWLAALALILRTRLTLGVLDLLFLGGLVAFTGWTALSLLWTASVPSTMREVQRDLAYVGIVAAALLLLRKRTVPHLVGGVLAGITVICLYSLGTRLLPDRLEAFDSDLYGYRLANPIGYWNGLGIFAAIGLLLAFTLAANGRHAVTRATAAAAMPFLAATLYFTFSRGAWGALAVGLLFAFTLSPQRVRLSASLLLFAPWPVLAVAEAARRDALDTRGATLADATAQGSALLVLIVLLAATAAGVALFVSLFERRVVVPRSLRRGFAVAVVIAALAGAATVYTQVGTPQDLVSRAYDSFRAPPKATGEDLSQRLFQLSSNGRIELWRVSWQAYEADPILGHGAGTFWQMWVASDRAIFATTEGHSLALETLGELGLPGALLLGLTLLAPLVAAGRARSHPFAAGVGAAMTAWLAHAMIDWDWELPGVVAAMLASAAALVALARRTDASLPRLPRIVGAMAAACLAGATIPTIVAEHRLRTAEVALDTRTPGAIEAARGAQRWAPWSSDAYRLESDALARGGHLGRARGALSEAIARDPDNWLLWYRLARLTTGAERQSAATRARELHVRLR